MQAYYFSASWCGPCKNFTPMLAEFYAKLRDAGISSELFEIFFVSSDRAAEDYRVYRATMPWDAVAYADVDRKAELAKAYGVRSIPDLVVVSAADNSRVISRSGRGDVVDSLESSATSVYERWRKVLHEANYNDI